VTCDDLRVLHWIIHTDTSRFDADVRRMKLMLWDFAFADAYNRATCRAVTAR
jgi:hypothetical protein